MHAMQNSKFLQNCNKLINKYIKIKINTGTLSEFSANDAKFSVNARYVWYSFVDRDSMIKFWCFQLNDFQLHLKEVSRK